MRWQLPTSDGPGEGSFSVYASVTAELLELSSWWLCCFVLLVCFQRGLCIGRQVGQPGRLAQRVKAGFPQAEETADCWELRLVRDHGATPPPAPPEGRVQINSNSVKPVCRKSRES